MALIVVNLTDTFNDWRLKTNTSIAQIGDLTTLTTANQASIVGAINTLLEEVVDDLTPQLGGPLDVNDKAIVSAVGTNKNITITPDGTGKAIITKGTYSGELGGALDVNGNAIISAASSNGNITLTPDGTGKVVITKGDYTGSLNTATTAVTQSASNNSTKVATTAYVDAQVATEDTLAEMNDTTISGGLANLDVLQYTGSAWENQTLAEAGIPTKGFTVAMAIALG